MNSVLYTCLCYTAEENAAAMFKWTELVVKKVLPISL